MSRIIAIFGQTASGKSTLLRELLRRHSDEFTLIPSMTTRPPREEPSEVKQDQKFYNYVSPDYFQRMIDKDEFVEWVKEHDMLYGKAKRDVDTALTTKRQGLMQIEYRGVLSFRKIYGEQLVAIFIAAPSREELIRRLKARGTETEESLKVRLRSIEREEKTICYADYTVVNDVVERAVRELELIILGRSDLSLPRSG